MADLTRDSTHFTEEQLVWFFYGEAENAAEIDLHLTLCGQCRADYERLKADMGAIAGWTTPERGAEYGEQVWRALVRKDAAIASRRRLGWRDWFLPRRMAAVAMMAVLIVIAFLAGRVSHPGDPASPANAAIAREHLLAAALTDHIEQSERTLLEVINSSGDTVDIRAEQQRAESLLTGNRLYRQAAEQQGRPILTDVLEDLERVLLEIAHAPSSLSAAEAGKLRTRIEDQELLFRLRVIELRLRRIQEAPVRQVSQQDSKG